ncbi:hypothetical protein [Nocardioides sp. URHA0020]|uniref:hypothetical protein n=1 Tax=Nocardioides sp. URHA0020 TaxID=1380392 RepID=UPI000491EDEF|nr:hypothetical protein [Nocardioides sp. URHA0020]
MSRSAHPQLTAAAVAAGLVLTLAGCSDDDPKADPSSKPSLSASSSAPSGSTSPTATAEASPSVSPATGPLLKMPNATIKAPKDWIQASDLIDIATEANPPSASLSAVRLGSIEYTGPTIPLDLQAESAIDSYAERGTLKRLPDVELDGVTLFHVAGSPRKGIHLDAYGVRQDGWDTDVQFRFDRAFTPAQRKEIIAQSLATFDWTG